MKFENQIRCGNTFYRAVFNASNKQVACLKRYGNGEWFLVIPDNDKVVNHRLGRDVRKALSIAQRILREKYSQLLHKGK